MYAQFGSVGGFLRGGGDERALGSSWGAERAVKRRHSKSERRKPSVFDAGISATASAAGTGLATVLAVSGSPLAAAIAMAPAGIKLAVEQTMYVVGERSKNRLISTAVDEGKTTIEGLAESIRDAGPEALPLTLEVFESAARTLNDQKIDALARVWLHGLSEDADLAKDLMMVRCLAQLEAPHIQVLKSFDDVKIYSEISVHQALDRLKPMVSAILNTLVQVGMLNDQAQQQAFEGRYYQIDEWGRLALKYLNDRANTE